MENNQILKIIPTKIPRNVSIRLGKQIAKLKRVAGVSEDLIGPLEDKRIGTTCICNKKGILCH